MKVSYQTPPCIHCGKSSIVPLNQQDLAAWQGGEHVQSVWPELSSDERELIMTGIHPECWDAMFPDDDEGDEGDEWGEGYIG